MAPKLDTVSIAVARRAHTIAKRDATLAARARAAGSLARARCDRELARCGTVIAECDAVILFAANRKSAVSQRAVAVADRKGAMAWAPVDWKDIAAFDRVIEGLDGIVTQCDQILASLGYAA